MSKSSVKDRYDNREVTAKVVNLEHRVDKLPDERALMLMSQLHDEMKSETSNFVRNDKDQVLSKDFIFTGNLSVKAPTTATHAVNLDYFSRYKNDGALKLDSDEMQVVHGKVKYMGEQIYDEKVYFLKEVYRKRNNQDYELIDTQNYGKFEVRPSITGAVLAAPSGENLVEWSYITTHMAETYGKLTGGNSFTGTNTFTSIRKWWGSGEPPKPANYLEDGRKASDLISYYDLQQLRVLDEEGVSVGVNTSVVKKEEEQNIGETMQVNTDYFQIHEDSAFIARPPTNSLAISFHYDHPVGSGLKDAPDNETIYAPLMYTSLAKDPEDNYAIKLMSGQAEVTAFTESTMDYKITTLPSTINGYYGSESWNKGLNVYTSFETTGKEVFRLKTKTDTGASEAVFQSNVMFGPTNYGIKKSDGSLVTSTTSFQLGSPAVKIVRTPNSTFEISSVSTESQETSILKIDDVGGIVSVIHGGSETFKGPLTIRAPESTTTSSTVASFGVESSGLATEYFTILTPGMVKSNIPFKQYLGGEEIISLDVQTCGNGTAPVLKLDSILSYYRTVGTNDSTPIMRIGYKDSTEVPIIKLDKDKFSLDSPLYVHSGTTSIFEVRPLGGVWSSSTYVPQYSNEGLYINKMISSTLDSDISIFSVKYVDSSVGTDTIDSASIDYNPYSGETTNSFKGQFILNGYSASDEPIKEVLHTSTGWEETTRAKSYYMYGRPAGATLAECEIVRKYDIRNIPPSNGNWEIQSLLFGTHASQDTEEVPMNGNYTAAHKLATHNYVALKVSGAIPAIGGWRNTACVGSVHLKQDDEDSVDNLQGVEKFATHKYVTDKLNAKVPSSGLWTIPPLIKAAAATAQDVDEEGREAYFATHKFVQDKVDAIIPTDTWNFTQLLRGKNLSQDSDDVEDPDTVLATHKYVSEHGATIPTSGGYLLGCVMGSSNAAQNTGDTVDGVTDNYKFATHRYIADRLGTYVSNSTFESTLANYAKTADVSAGYYAKRSGIEINSNDIQFTGEHDSYRIAAGQLRMLSYGTWGGPNQEFKIAGVVNDNTDMAGCYMIGGTTGQAAAQLLIGYKQKNAYNWSYGAIWARCDTNYTKLASHQTAFSNANEWDDKLEQGLNAFLIEKNIAVPKRTVFRRSLTNEGGKHILVDQQVLLYEDGAEMILSTHKRDISVAVDSFRNKNRKGGIV